MYERVFKSVPCLTTIISPTHYSAFYQEDECLISLVQSHIQDDIFRGKWPEVAKALGTGRTAKQCRDRWLNYLRPGLKKGQWSEEEEQLLEDMFDTFGPR